MRYTKPKDAILEGSIAPELSAAIKEVAGVFRRFRLDYHQTAYIVRRARALQHIAKAKVEKRLPKVLTDQQVSDFFASIRSAGNSEHFLMFQILWTTGLRVSEFCRVRRNDLDLTNLTISVVQGKGSKDRTVLLPDQLALAVRMHMDSTDDQKFLFETNRKTSYSIRYMQHLAQTYGHSFESLLTFSARNVNKKANPKRLISGWR